ncbi:hypothetical protein P3T27_005626 [Kitasatospora sp. MAA19]|uniref:Scr1 family TA system antitoxin-like transcriptional regulator n=1 Tax=Kitasatospora sp. MAA19 TaxID=3035090 RepID=UPI002473D77D|nr:Scr1 family TA system antitoxin-like transcriptional regulator [Kitasatospora sp. MAA19]MDH6708880.1 hypothetical protein [Kitasatospora sp. MAA19]
MNRKELDPASSPRESFGALLRRSRAPFSLAEHAPFRAFVTLLTFADRSVVGYTESADHGFVVREDRTVRAWERAYDRLRVEALTRAASLDLIHKARKEL